MSFFQSTTLIALTLIAWHIIALLRTKTVAHQFHASFLAVLAIPLIHNFALLAGLTPPPIATVLCHSLLLVYGPMLYLFLRYIVKRPSRHWQWHFAPYIFVVCFKIGTGGDYPPLILVAFFFSHVTFYTVQTLLLLRTHKRLLKILLGRFAGASQHWLLWQVLAIALLALMDTIIIAWLSSGHQINPWVWQSVMLCLTLYVLSIAALTAWQPRLFEGDQRAIARPQKLATARFTLRQLELDAPIAIALGEKLNACVKEQQLYRHNDLSLDALAASMGISRQQMSELLNVHLKTGFYEFINDYRIADAKAELCDSDASVLDIGFAVGFNSKNAFYRAFKLATNMTPGDFRKQSRTPSTPTKATKELIS